MKIFVKSFLIVFCLLLAFGSCQGRLPEGQVVVYGDSQHNPEVQRRLVRTILSCKPSIVFRVGDLVDEGNRSELWKDFREIHGPLLGSSEYFPALGNHERDAPFYFENFPLLEGRRWYSVDRRGIHFVVLDSNSKLGPGSEQYLWLVSDLAKADGSARFIVVLFHHPLFDAGVHHPSDERQLSPVLMPLFERHRVSAVFSGHSHNYQRFERNGIVFVVTGGGGSRLVGRGPRPIRGLKKFNAAYHFCLLIPGEDVLRVKAVDIGLNTIDGFEVGSRAVERT